MMRARLWVLDSVAHRVLAHCPHPEHRQSEEGERVTSRSWRDVLPVLAGMTIGGLAVGMLVLVAKAIFGG